MNIELDYIIIKTIWVFQMIIQALMIFILIK